MLPKHNMLRRSKTKIQVGIGHVCMISQIVAFLHSLWLDSCGGSIQFIGVQACQQKMHIGKLYICWPVRPVWVNVNARDVFFGQWRCYWIFISLQSFNHPWSLLQATPQQKNKHTTIFHFRNYGSWIEKSRNSSTDSESQAAMTVGLPVWSGL